MIVVTKDLHPNGILTNSPVSSAPPAPLLLLMIAACNESPQVLSESASIEQGEWQLVAQEYPYTGEHGELVCAKWELVIDNAELPEIDWEVYHPDVMSRQLDGAPLPGEEISVDILDAIRSAGIAGVETCDEARRFIQIKREVIESAPFVSTTTEEDAPLPNAIFDGCRSFTTSIISKICLNWKGDKAGPPG